MRKKTGSKINFYLPIDLQEWLKNAAKADNRTPSNFIATLLTEKKNNGR
jgi:uncharacterized protein (DUF1778 family)